MSKKFFSVGDGVLFEKLIKVVIPTVEVFQVFERFYFCERPPIFFDTISCIVGHIV